MSLDLQRTDTERPGGASSRAEADLDRVHEDNRRLRAIVQLGQELSAELDLDTVLARVVRGAVELLGGVGGSLSLTDESGRARVRALYGLPRHLLDLELGTGKGMSGQVLRRRAPVFVADYALDLPEPVEALSRLVHAGIGVPIWWQGELLGAFAVFRTDRGHVFTNRDREFLEILGTQVAVAIKNALLFGDARAQLEEAVGLQAASAAPAEELEPEKALRTMAEQALTLSGARTVSIELLDAESQQLETRVVAGEKAAELTGRRMRMDPSLAGAALVTPRSQIACMPPLGGSPGSTVCGARAQAVLVLPLRARGRTLGTLSAYGESGDTFQTRQIDLLEAFANQAAVSLDNARLYAELQTRLDEMVSIQKLGTLLLEEHDFDRVLQAVCQQLRKLTNAEGVGLALLDEGGEFLELRTVVGPSKDLLRGARIPVEGSFAGEALRTERPQRSADAQHDPRGFRRSLVLGNTRTIISVPMKTRQRDVGVLSIYNKQGSAAFSDHDAELARLFANQAAVAVENARLYEQTRAYATIEERNRLARELHDSVTQSLFSISLLSQAALNLWDRDGGRARERLERATELAQGALAEMRALLFELRPTALGEEGLVSALRKHAAAVHSRDGLNAFLHLAGEERRLPPAMEEAAFRIAQESLNNVVKHAHATEAVVRVTFDEVGVRLSAEDDGIGFDLSLQSEEPTMGMTSMRERAESVGGHLSVESSQGQGTRVVAELPWPSEGGGDEKHGRSDGTTEAAADSRRDRGRSRDGT